MLNSRLILILGLLLSLNAYAQTTSAPNTLTPQDEQFEAEIQQMTTQIQNMNTEMVKLTNAFAKSLNDSLPVITKSMTEIIQSLQPVVSTLQQNTEMIAKSIEQEMNKQQYFEDVISTNESNTLNTENILYSTQDNEELLVEINKELEQLAPKTQHSNQQKIKLFPSSTY